MRGTLERLRPEAHHCDEDGDRDDDEVDQHHLALAAAHVGGGSAEHQKDDARGSNTDECRATSSTAGTIRPMAARTSRAPMPLIWESAKSSIQSILPDAISCSLDCVSFMAPAPSMTMARRHWTIQVTVFMGGDPWSNRAGYQRYLDA